MKRSAISIAICIAMVAIAIGCGWNGPDLSFAESSTDVYFGTEGTPQGPAAPTPHETVYPRIGSLDSRLLVWFVTQQHTYFGGFVLALPLFCALLEFLGLITQKPALALRYDGLARDLAKVAVLALSVTALIGSV
ncbi:MAG TPA: hypothetical protein VFU48_11630, partial [Nitrospira sp.]|nr:hypothetical protein [Nitrospira sp.]